jgi:putative ABC transport system substrate-binding protein
LPARAAKAATTTIPIVFVNGSDPVRIGLVDSINRPGKNVTGVTGLAGDLTPKRLQLLHDLVPSAKVFGLLRNPSNNFSQRPVLDTVAVWGGTVHPADARTVADFDVAFASLAGKRIEALVILADTLFASGSARIVALAAQYAIPTVYPQLDATKSGGLMSYSADTADAYRQAAIYAGRILRGTKPADLPILLPTKFVFGVNLGTAKTLGLTINPGLLAIADEVIE